MPFYIIGLFDFGQQIGVELSDISSIPRLTNRVILRP